MAHRSIMVRTVLVFLVSVVLTASAQEKKQPVVLAKASGSYGKYAFTFITLDGKKISLADYAGKVVLVNIWAPWCGPCRKETPGFANLYQQYHSKGFEILGVAVQTNESDVRAFIEKYKPAWPIGINDNVAKNYGTYGLPDSYLFRADGSLAKRFFGYAQEEAVKPVLEEALKEVSFSKTK